MGSEPKKLTFGDFKYGLRRELINKIELYLEKNNAEALQNLVGELRFTETAEYISIANHDNRNRFLEITKYIINPYVLLNLETNLRNNVINILGAEIAAKLISELELDDIVYIIEALDSEQSEEILGFLPRTKVNAIEKTLEYPENSAGRIMNQKMITVLDYWSVKQTIEYLRKIYSNKDQFHEVYVLDLQHKPVGVVDVSRLICAEKNMVMSEIMNKDIMVVRTDLDQEEVSIICKEYDLNSVPVVNKKNRLVGVITLDDIVEIVEEETEEDMLRLGGLSETDIHLDFLSASKKRLPWLFVNLSSAFVSSHVISVYEHDIEKVVALAAILPMVASMGGNAGTQTITIMIRAIALKDIVESNTSRIIVKEILTCLTSGLFIAVIASLSLFMLYRNQELSLIFGCALVLNFITAGIMGSVIPISLNKLKIDPAIASGIFLTAITDSIGFLIFLLLAKFFIVG